VNQRVIERLAELVARPSVSSASPAFDTSNAGVIELLSGWLKARGFRVEVTTVARNPDKLNLLATAGSGAEGLVLTGHTDTVPYDAAAWSSDPFRLTERDGKLYGLGVADMKCFFALALEALDGVDLAALRQPLSILATADEESSMCGARALARDIPGRYVLIGEPTGLQPINRHKGVVWLGLTVEGRSGHASDPGLGRNAIEGMQAVIGALLRWRDALISGTRDADFAVPWPTMNLGTIAGGDNPNRICARCTLQLDMRILPSMNPSQVLDTVRELARKALAGTDFGLQVEQLLDPIPPFRTGPESRVVRFAEQVTGHPAQTVAFATEGPFFNALGKETVILGPGDIAVAHQPDEYLQLDRIEPMIEILRRFIDHFCVRQDESDDDA
jgi:acetylornithine deacetylase